MESYEKAEKRFFENLRLRESKFEEERMDWQRKLDESIKDERDKNAQLMIRSAIMKWRFIISIIKLKGG